MARLTRSMMIIRGKKISFIGAFTVPKPEIELTNSDNGYVVNISIVNRIPGLLYLFTIDGSDPVKGESYELTEDGTYPVTDNGDVVIDGGKITTRIPLTIKIKAFGITESSPVVAVNVVKCAAPVFFDKSNPESVAKDGQLILTGESYYGISTETEGAFIKRAFNYTGDPAEIPGKVESPWYGYTHVNLYNYRAVACKDGCLNSDVVDVIVLVKIPKPVYSVHKNYVQDEVGVYLSLDNYSEYLNFWGSGYNDSIIRVKKDDGEYEDIGTPNWARQYFVSKNGKYTFSAYRKISGMNIDSDETEVIVDEFIPIIGYDESLLGYDDTAIGGY